MRIVPGFGRAGLASRSNEGTSARSANGTFVAFAAEAGLPIGLRPGFRSLTLVAAAVT